MKNLSFNEMAQVNGEGFLQGLCGGVSIGTGVASGVYMAAQYGLIAAAAPPLGVAAGVLGIAGLLTCGAATILG